LLHRRADDALAHFEPYRLDDFRRVADGVRDAQFLSALVEEVHREGVEGGEPRDELRNLREQFIEVEHRRDLTSQLEQRMKKFPVSGRPTDRNLEAAGFFQPRSARPRGRICH